MTLVLPGGELEKSCISWNLDYWNSNKKFNSIKKFDGVLQVYFMELSGWFISADLEISDSWAEKTFKF